MPIEVDDAGVIGEARTRRLHDGPSVGEGARGGGGFGIGDVLGNVVGRVGEVVGRAVFHDPRTLFVLRGEAACGRNGPEGLAAVRRTLDAPRVRDHVRVQLHVARNTSSEIEICLPVIVDEDGGIDVASLVWATPRDERLAYGVLVRADGAIGDSHSDDRRAGFIAQGDVEVELAVAGDGLWCPG